MEKKVTTIRLKNKRNLKTFGRLILFIIFWILFLSMGKCEAANLYSIENCVVTVEPKTNESTYNYLNITYEITCKILSTEKPISCIEINTIDDSNGYFKEISSISDNISGIQPSQYLSISGTYSPYIMIYLSREYNFGETFTFQYSINKYNPPERSWTKCTYRLSPYNFINLELDNITLRWNINKVKNNKFHKQKDNYLIWNNIKKETGNIKIQYKRKDFPLLNEEISVMDDVKYDMRYTFVVIIVFAILILIFYFEDKERRFQRKSSINRQYFKKEWSFRNRSK